MKELGFRGGSDEKMSRLWLGRKNVVVGLPPLDIQCTGYFSVTVFPGKHDQIETDHQEPSLCFRSSENEYEDEDIDPIDLSQLESCHITPIVTVPA